MDNHWHLLFTDLVKGFINTCYRLRRELLVKYRTSRYRPWKIPISQICIFRKQGHIPAGIQPLSLLDNVQSQMDRINFILTERFQMILNFLV